MANIQISLCDMHSHILPGVDDGSKSMEMTGEMLKIAYEQGIRYMTATPHFIAGYDNVPVNKLVEVYKEVQKKALEIGEDFHIFLGNELFYSEGITDSLDSHKALTINGSRYALIEFDVGERYSVIYEGLSTMIKRGYFPIIAHIERYKQLFKQYDKIEELIKLGVYVQVNISSLEGKMTDQVAVFCRKLLKYGMIHIFGTDAHRDVGRAPYMQEGVRYINKKYGFETTKQLLYNNPMKILKDKII